MRTSHNSREAPRRAIESLVFWRFTILEIAPTSGVAVTTMIGGSRNARSATVVIASLAGEFGSRENLPTTGAFIIKFLPIVMLFTLQGFFVRGITAGSVKS